MIYFANHKGTIIFIFIGLLLMQTSHSYAQINEYRIKSIFFEKFSSYVEWPENHELNKSQSEFIIGILGTDPFENYLSIYKQTKIKGRKVVIRRISNLSECLNCHIIYISYSEKYRLSSILDYLRGEPVLTIGDSEGFAEKGVMFNMVLNENRIEFEVNEESIKKSKLTVSYKLLMLAKHIY